MRSALDIKQTQLALLKTRELDEICRTIADIVGNSFQANAVGVLLWDQDLEAFSMDYRFAFGEQGDEMAALLGAIVEAELKFGDAGGADECFSVIEQLNNGHRSQPLKDLTGYRIASDEVCLGLLLVAGDALLSTASLEAALEPYPLAEALGNGYEMAELRRDVERLREQYSLLENDFQEQKKQINLSKKSASAVSERNDKERLIYEISNAVRSSLDTDEVLSTAVNKIGQAFNLSRCLVIRSAFETDENVIYEYANDCGPARELFSTEAGRAFAQAASLKTAPYHFCQSDNQEMFNPEFIGHFKLLSGMLVPLIYHDRNIGSMFLQDCKTEREWSIDNTAYIGSLADLITVAIGHANLHEEKKRQAVTDGLTGISNRRHFNETFSREFERAKRYGHVLSLVVVDLDFLKKINDTFGHPVGDQAIKAIGAVLSRSCRAVDTAARFGGEEFCLLLPDTNEADAMLLAERVRKRINETVIEGPGCISASLGLATYPQHASEQEELFEAADRALYSAKQGGRNKVCVAQPLGESNNVT